jgi:hypothetical protein
MMTGAPVSAYGIKRAAPVCELRAISLTLIIQLADPVCELAWW